MPLKDARFSQDISKIHEFFRLMNRQFTPDEWQQIRQKNSEDFQLSSFFRFWTLKESFVKGLGTGLGWNLQRLSFTIHSPELVVQKLCHDSELCIDRVPAQNWHFEETLLDSQHIVCTAICTTTSYTPAAANNEDHVFAFVTPQILIQAFNQPTMTEDQNDWNNFCQKIKAKPF